MEEINADVLDDVRKNGEKHIIGTGCMLVPDAVLDVIEEYNDLKIELEAAERLKKPQGKLYTLEEVMAECGITQEMLDSVPDEDIE